MFSNFFAICALATAVIALTSLVTYEVLRVVWNRLPHLHIAPRARVLLIIVPIFLVHIFSIWVYAAVYFLVEYYTDLGALKGHIMPVAFEYESFLERLYFSASTYASLGLGDITPTEHLRMLVSAEVLNGLVMIGWTVSFTYLCMEKFWSLPHRREQRE